MMRKGTKKWLIAAACLVVVGLIGFAGVMAFLDWDFTGLDTEDYVTNTYTINENFSKIVIDTQTADIVFAASDDGICKVVCEEQENILHSAAAQDGTLTVTEEDTRTWYEHIGFNLQTPSITVYLPEAEYASLVITESTGDITLPDGFLFDEVDLCLSTGDVSVSSDVSSSLRIRTSTGDVRVENAGLGALTVAVTTGDTLISNVTCKNLSSDGSTGDLTLKNVTAAENLTIERSTGDVKLDGVDAAAISVDTSTGDITGTLLSEKIFVASTDTGRIKVPESTSGGECRLTTSTGDITIKLN